MKRSRVYKSTKILYTNYSSLACKDIIAHEIQNIILYYTAAADKKLVLKPAPTPLRNTGWSNMRKIIIHAVQGVMSDLESK